MSWVKWRSLVLVAVVVVASGKTRDPLMVNRSEIFGKCWDENCGASIT